ncbi:insulinase family protein, partial [Priestia megaterium]|uniref:insulinase family protein n=1 Tax=Priestia megaterium TaxID=1404 RepID=UPI0012B6F577
FFKPTKTTSPPQIPQTFHPIPPQLNPFTSKQYTSYYPKLLHQHPHQPLHLLPHIFFNSSFHQHQLPPQKNLLYQQIKIYQDTPHHILHHLLRKPLYPNHPLPYPILPTQH